MPKFINLNDGSTPLILDKTIKYRDQLIEIYRQCRTCYAGDTVSVWYYQINGNEPIAVGRRTYAIAQAGRSIDDDLDGIVGKVRFDYTSGRKTSWDEDYKRTLGK